MFTYRAIIEKEDDQFSVIFPDFDCCVTSGDTYTEALEMAQDVLNGYILTLNDLDQEIPKPSQGEGIFFEVDNKIAFALELKKTRKKEKLTQIEVARRLNISQPTYQKLEDPTKSNPSLGTITKIEKVIGKKLLHFFN